MKHTEVDGHHVVKYDQKCTSCSGTGLYVGFAEQNGAAVICRTCSGAGWHAVKLEWDDFTIVSESKDVKRVFAVNPGVSIGEGEGVCTLEDFGGIPYDEWFENRPDHREFAHGTEDRQHTCPAWYWQSCDYKLKPNWDECIVCGSFPGCEHFADKDKCWGRFDRERQVRQVR